MASPAADVLAPSRQGRLNWFLSPRRFFWLVVAAMVGSILLGLGTVAFYKISVDAQHARVERIHQLGGEIHRSGSRDEKNWTPGQLLGENWEPLGANVLLVDTPVDLDFPALVKEASRVSGTEALWLHGTPLNDDQLKSLVNRRSLKELAIAGTDITDAGLESLVKCSNLKVLDLRLTGVTDEGIDTLAKIESLERVDFRHSRVTPLGAAKLQAALPNVRIWCAPAPTDEHWRVLRDVGRRGGLWQHRDYHDGLADEIIISIDPMGTWSEFDWESLKAIDGLKCLYVEEQPLPTEMFAILANAKQFERLILNKVELDDGAVEQIGSMTKLKFLSLHECKLDWRSVKDWLGQLKTLESLGLNGAPIDANILTAVASLPKLTSLSLYYCQLENQALAAIGLPRQLESLSLSRSNLSDEGLRSIARCRRLTFLDICNTQVSDDALDLILSLPALETANLHGSSMSPAVIDKIDAVFKTRAAKPASGAAP